jgi:hypothetical protein
MSGFHALGDVQAVARVGLAGMLARLSSDDKVVSARNKNPQAKQVFTIAIGGSFSAGDVYVCTIDGNTFNYTSVSGDTDNDGVAASIKAALEQDPIFGAIATYTVATTVVTATVRWPGRSVTIASGDDLTLATTTAAAAANPVSFGAVVVLTDESQDAPYGAQAISTLFTAQVDTHLITYDASVMLTCEIEVDGKTVVAAVTMATDAATSVEALKTELNVQLDLAFAAGASVVATRSSDTLTLTAEVAGRGFTSRVSFGPARDTGAVTTTTTYGPSTAIQAARKGIALFAHDQERTAGEGGTTQYAANAIARVVIDGIVFVANTQGVAAGEKVYVELGGSASYGNLYNAHSTNRTLLPGWRWMKAHTSSSLAEVQVRS